ncbi:MAG: urease accessory protein UreE [Cyanobacteriota bacterium]
MQEGACPPEQPLLLVRRLAAIGDPGEPVAGTLAGSVALTAAPLPVPPLRLRLALTADQRTSLRGHRRSVCGRDLLLQLPRDQALRPGDRLLSADAGVEVLVEAAPEPVMRVRAADPLALLQAAYHLGNRHVAMELHPDQLVLLQDGVLADLLRQRGLGVECCEAPFQPEAGAYAGFGHDHDPSQRHGHAHDHGHGDRHDPAHEPRHRS